MTFIKIFAGKTMRKFFKNMNFFLSTNWAFASQKESNVSRDFDRLMNRYISMAGQVLVSR